MVHVGEYIPKHRTAQRATKEEESELKSLFQNVRTERQKNLEKEKYKKTELRSRATERKQKFEVNSHFL